MPALARALAALPLQTGWIDGEVLMLDSDDRPDFQALQNAFDGEHTDLLVFFAFDLLWHDGQDLRQQPVEQRRQRLQELLHKAPSDRVRFSQAFDAPPADLMAAACRLGLEGVIGKRRGSAYVSRRSMDWIKLKCGHRQEFVIAGYTDPQGSRTGLGPWSSPCMARTGSCTRPARSARVSTHAPWPTCASAWTAWPPAHPRWQTPGALAARCTGCAPPCWPKSRSRNGPRTAASATPYSRACARTSLRAASQRGATARAIDRIFTPHRKPPQSRPAPHGQGGAPARHDRHHPCRACHRPSTGITKMELARYYATVAPS